VFLGKNVPKEHVALTSFNPKTEVATFFEVNYSLNTLQLKILISEKNSKYRENLYHTNVGLKQEIQPVCPPPLPLITFLPHLKSHRKTDTNNA
jgi:hypothetical protein